ncbi:MAG: hypothetical protein KIT80_00130 [Chitinophagaceae bacterium]|nr:hypothetical protein [Chitinophagaceae bacterium]MCW5925297.1 hypothetical protein [Chitinophagaceae bacterium]
MEQKMTFGNLINELYYGVNIKKMPVEEIVKILQSKADHFEELNLQQSLTTNLMMNLDGNVLQKSYLFTFSKSPVFLIPIDSCRIKLTIGKSNSIQKVIDIQWSMLFNDPIDGSLFFDKLKEKLIPFSSQYKIEKDDWNKGVFAQFSNCEVSPSQINDITLFFGTSYEYGKCEISLTPFSEFASE